MSFDFNLYKTSIGNQISTWGKKINKKVDGINKKAASLSDKDLKAANEAICIFATASFIKIGYHLCTNNLSYASDVAWPGLVLIAMRAGLEHVKSVRKFSVNTTQKPQTKQQFTQKKNTRNNQEEKSRVDEETAKVIKEMLILLYGHPRHRRYPDSFYFNRF